MSIIDKLKGLKDLQVREKIGSTLRFLRILGLFGIFIAGYLLGARAFETGNVSDKMKGANVTISGTCTLTLTGQDRIPALLDDEVHITSIDKEKNTLLGVIRKTREEVLCDTSKVSFSTLPLLSKWGIAPVAAPELTPAIVTKKLDPFWKQFEKKMLLVSGSCRGPDGKELPNFIDEKLEVTSTAQNSGMMDDEFTMAGIKRSDRQAVICNSKLITYKIYDSSMDKIEPPPVIGPIDYVGKIVTIDSRCLPDPQYLKARKIDPKTKLPIGRVPKFFNLLNTPVQVLSFKANDKDQITYLEGKIVDRSEPEAYGKKIICDSKIEKLVVKYTENKNSSLINQKGEDVEPQMPPTKLEVVTEGEDAVQPKQVAPAQPEKQAPVIDDNSKMEEILKELNK